MLCSLLMRGDAGCLDSVGLHWYRACLSLVRRASPFFLLTALIVWGWAFCISSCGLCMHSTYVSLYATVQTHWVVIVRTWLVILQQWLVIVQHWLEQQAAAAVCVLVTNIPSLCTDTICGQKVSSLTHPAHEVRGCVWSSSFLMLQLNWGHEDAINEHSLPTSHLICDTPYDN